MSLTCANASDRFRCQAAVALAELGLCVLPVSAGWAFGLGMTTWAAWNGAVSFAVPIYFGLAGAAYGIAALWAVLLPRALGKSHTLPLLSWHRRGLVWGSTAGLVGLVVVVAGTLGSPPGSLFWAYLFGSPILIALHVYIQSRQVSAES